MNKVGEKGASTVVSNRYRKKVVSSITDSNMAAEKIELVGAPCHGNTIVLGWREGTVYEFSIFFLGTMSNEWEEYDQAHDFTTEKHLEKLI